MNLTSINDSEILKEYVRRFTIQAGDRIKSSREAADHFRAFFSDAAKREHFVVCFCNGQNCVLDTETLFVGSLTTSAIYVRELIQRILELGAASILIAHNHPSGSITPSSSDRAVTKRIQSAVSTIEVEILDHIIIGGEEYFSFADAGLL
mgnify:CR=1 FL=1